MTNLTSADFWKATMVRCLRTFLTTLIGFWTAGTLITDVDWRMAFMTAASATVYILLLCIIAGIPEVTNYGPVDEYDTEDY